MAERSAAQIAATRRWMATHPSEFAEWLSKQPARLRLPPRNKTLFHTQNRQSGIPGPKIVIDGGDWDDVVAWINDPDNMRSPESGKLSRFMYRRNSRMATFRFSQCLVGFAFKMRFAAPKG
jgi:hypothetical protein